MIQLVPEQQRFFLLASGSNTFLWGRSVTLHAQRLRHLHREEIEIEGNIKS